MLIVLVPAGHTAAQTGAAPPAAGHRLVGTTEGGAFSGAVLTDPSGEQKFYRLNDLLPDGSRLFKLRSDSILIKRPDGSLSEVFVFRELSTAAPVISQPAVAPPANAPGEPATQRRRGQRHRPPADNASE